MTTNFDEHFHEECKDLEFRAHYALLDLAEKISEQIKTIREAKGFSQKQLAVMLNTQQPQVSRLEDPLYSRYSLLTLAKVADVLGVELKVSIEPRLVFKTQHSANTLVIPAQECAAPKYSGVESQSVKATVLNDAA